MRSFDVHWNSFSGPKNEYKCNSITSLRRRPCQGMLEYAKLYVVANVGRVQLLILSTRTLEDIPSLHTYPRFRVAIPVTTVVVQFCQRLPLTPIKGNRSNSLEFPFASRSTEDFSGCTQYLMSTFVHVQQRICI